MNLTSSMLKAISSCMKMVAAASLSATHQEHRGAGHTPRHWPCKLKRAEEHAHGPLHHTCLHALREQLQTQARQPRAKGTCCWPHTWNMAVGSGQSSMPVPPTTALPAAAGPAGLPWMLLAARCAATRELEHAVSTLVHGPWKPYRYEILHTCTWRGGRTQAGCWCAPGGRARA